MKRKIIYQSKQFKNQIGFLPMKGALTHQIRAQGSLTSYLLASVIHSRKDFLHLEDFAGLQFCNLAMSCNNLFTRGFCCWYCCFHPFSAPLTYFASCRAALNLFVQHLLEPHCNISLEHYPLKCFEVVPAEAVLITVASFQCFHSISAPGVIPAEAEATSFTNKINIMFSLDPTQQYKRYCNFGATVSKISVLSATFPSY